jgi:Leucine-rich repeat (LRR) protein
MNSPPPPLPLRTAMPARELIHLTLLDLQHNELDTLPSSIETLNKLVKLDLFHNAFKRLPREIAVLFELKVGGGGMRRSRGWEHAHPLLCPGRKLTLDGRQRPQPPSHLRI